MGQGAQLESVALCAMGGSAVAGDLAAAAYRDRAAVPMATVRGYRLPAWCRGPRSLVVCASYSGDTEETVSVYGEATRRGCRVVAVSSGGELEERAALDGVPVVPVEPRGPMPRAALGSLAGAVLGVLEAAGVVGPVASEVEEAASTLAALAERLAPGVPVAQNPAKAVARWVGDRVPVIWGSEGVAEVAAWRWKTAFNENAKVPAFASALPELDHHEVQGWSAGRGEGFGVIVLRHEGEEPHVGPRVGATVAAVTGSGVDVREVSAPGSTPLAAGLALMLVGDCAAAYHALARGVDPTPIPAITGLKERLGRPG